MQLYKDRKSVFSARIQNLPIDRWRLECLINSIPFERVKASSLSELETKILPIQSLWGSCQKQCDFVVEMVSCVKITYFHFHFLYYKSLNIFKKEILSCEALMDVGGFIIDEEMCQQLLNITSCTTGPISFILCVGFLGYGSSTQQGIKGYIWPITNINTAQCSLLRSGLGKPAMKY